ncbi:hypothetical protein QUA54_09255 [Microcoleus sp. MOSTC5]|uniref:ApeA N-terminal domain 1-containing protein n=1 Tax=Microcoleus sp. MOSTC5 TaxID=3055378 RepID=UPI002FD44A06
MEEFISLGKWWLPNSPEVVVPGKLSFSANGGVKLELLGSFYDSPFQEVSKEKDLLPAGESLLPENLKATEETTIIDLIKPEETIILGLLENNEEVTLYKCYGSLLNFELIDRHDLFFQAAYLFRQIHFKNEQEIKFTSISVRYFYLEEWIGKSGIQGMWSGKENKIWLSYQPPSSIPMGEFKALDLSISFSQIYLNPFDIYFGRTYYKGSVEQKTFLTLHNPKNEPLDKCVEVILHFRDFLTFAISKPSSISAVTGNVNVSYERRIFKDDGSPSIEKGIKEKQVNILFSVWNSENSSEIKIFPYEMLFLYSDIEGELGEVFKQWLHKKELYESVFELFMVTMYTPNLYLHYRFLNMIQALEVYHGNKYKESKYQQTKIYQEGISKNLLEVIAEFPPKNRENPHGISDDFRAALKGQVSSNLNRFTLHTRLTEILEDITHLLPDNFVGGADNIKSFISKAITTRNALTHHSKKAAKPEELVHLFQSLKVIIQCCLLRELGLTDESIKKLIKRNINY